MKPFVQVESLLHGNATIIFGQPKQEKARVKAKDLKPQSSIPNTYEKARSAALAKR